MEVIRNLKLAKGKDGYIPCCGNCKYFFKGPPNAANYCVRHPVATSAIADAVCGEHPKFITAPKIE